MDNPKPVVTQSAEQSNIKLNQQFDSVYELHGQARLALRRMFESLDLDNSGKISAAEVQSLLGISLEEAKEMIAGIDNNSDYEIDFNEFVQLMTTKGASRVSWIPAKVIEEYQAVFTSICSKHGQEKTVTVYDLAHDLKIPAHQLQGYLKGCDDVRKYTIDFETFVELMIDPRIQLGNKTGTIQKFEAIGEEEEEEHQTETKIETVTEPKTETKVEKPKAEEETKKDPKMASPTPNKISIQLIETIFPLASSSRKAIDLKNMCLNLGTTEDEAKNLIRSADIDGDGEINLDEYKQAISENKDFSIWIPLSVKEKLRQRYQTFSSSNPSSVSFSAVGSNLQLKDGVMDEWKTKKYPNESSISFDMYVISAVELAPNLVLGLLEKKKSCCVVM